MCGCLPVRLEARAGTRLGRRLLATGFRVLGLLHCVAFMVYLFVGVPRILCALAAHRAPGSWLSDVLIDQIVLSAYLASDLFRRGFYLLPGGVIPRLQETFSFAGIQVSERRREAVPEPQWRHCSTCSAVLSVR